MQASCGILASSVIPLGEHLLLFFCKWRQVCQTLVRISCNGIHQKIKLRYQALNRRRIEKVGVIYKGPGHVVVARDHRQRHVEFDGANLGPPPLRLRLAHLEFLHIVERKHHLE